VEDPDAELLVYIVIFSLIEIIRRILFLFRLICQDKCKLDHACAISMQCSLNMWSAR
jgi:hypothetical protein